MSNEVFPVLPGLEWGVKKSPRFTTRVQRAVSGREVRAGLMVWPLYQFELAYEFLRKPDLDTLAGFYCARRGALESFLFTDPQDNSVTAQSFGVGDGSTTDFQLQRAWGGFVEPVHNINVLDAVLIDDVVVPEYENYSVSDTGLVSFSTAPLLGAQLSWSGTYFFRVRFVDDNADFVEFMQALWQLKKLAFIGSLQNKV